MERLALTGVGVGVGASYVLEEEVQLRVAAGVDGDLEQG